MSIKFEDLPDTITPKDYAEWRGIGRDLACRKFNTKGFPRLGNVGNRILADKRAVLMYDLNLKSDDYAKIINDVIVSNNSLDLNEEQTFKITLKKI